MNMWQTILNAITFGAYNPDKKFEQEVLGEATTNLEQIESLRNDVSEATTEYEKYFPNEDNAWNPFELYDSYPDMGIDIDEETKEIKTNADKNATVSNLVELEEQLQEQGKYVGMDEKTRIKAVLAEGLATEASATLLDRLNVDGQSISESMLEAYKISAYQNYMDKGLKSYNPPEARTIIDSVEEAMYNFGGEPLNSLAVTFMGSGGYLLGKIKGAKYMSDNQVDNKSGRNQKIVTEKYVSMILANDKATRQNDGTYLTKTSEEWAKMDEEKEQTLRNMPYEDLLTMGRELAEQLKNRYDELEADKGDNERK